MASKLSKLFWSADRKRREFAILAANFAIDNKQALVIIADPVTDVILISHGGEIVPTRFTKPETGANMHIVQNVLHYQNKKTDKSIDQFLLAVDSALFNLAKARYTKRKNGMVGKALRYVGLSKDRPEFEPEGMKSPFQLQNVAEQDATQAQQLEQENQTNGA